MGYRFIPRNPHPPLQTPARRQLQQVGAGGTGPGGTGQGRAGGHAGKYKERQDPMEAGAVPPTTP